ncbi:Acyl-coenzyme A thioesterase 12 [Tulasnella sp. JGI-2019a]|nr:Acyl-coenzyme A thioesterase 12 [Tulasnella sp. JGI-2019a]
MQAHKRLSLGFALATTLLGLYAYHKHSESCSCDLKEDTEPELVANVEPDSKPMAESSVNVSYRITNDMTDVHGRMYAGEMLKMIDIMAGVVSRRHAELSTVTISLDRFIVVQEVRAGDLIHLHVSVNRAWGSSMETGVKVTRESATRGEQYCCHAYLTFVALAPSSKNADGPSSSIRLGGRAPDANRQRPKIKKIVPGTLLERKRYILAGRRRELRLVHSRSSKDVVDFRAEVLAMGLQDASRYDMINSSADRSEALAFIEKQILADALINKDPSLVYSKGPEGEDRVSVSAHLLGDLEPSALDSVAVSELQMMGKGEEKARRTSWIGPGESMLQRRPSNWMIEPRSPIKRIGGDFKILSPLGENLESSGAELGGQRTRVLPISATFASTLHIVMPQHANSAGILFGGQLMAWMEKTALIAAHRFKADDCAWTTAGMDGLEFREAVAIGDVLTFRAVVTKSWKSSIEVYVCSHADIPGSATPRTSVRFTNECFLTLVALSPATSTAIPLRTDLIVTPDTVAERVFIHADERKVERLAMKDMLSRVYANQSDDDKES